MRTSCFASLVAVFVVAVFAAPRGAAEPSSESIEMRRDAAYTLLRRGEVMPAAFALLDALRALPKDDMTAPDRAIEPFHLLAFTVDYLMDPGQQTYFTEEVLDPAAHDIDELFQCVFWFNLDSGLNKGEATLVRERLIGLSYRENTTVRAGTLFLNANPYYSYSSNTAFLSRKKLNKQFPDLEITKVALRMPVLNRRHDYGEALAAWNHERDDEAVRNRMAADPVLQQIVPHLNALRAGSDSEKAAEGAALLTGVRGALDWRTRYSVLLMVEPLIEKGLSQPLKSVCTEWAGRPQCTPDVVRAHMALASLARHERDANALAYWAGQLIALEHAGNPIDRNLYEDIMKAALQAGDALAEMGAAAQAAGVYEALAAKFPNSALAAVCQSRVAAVDAGGPLP